MVETLVMMIVAGIVFLSVMDALGLFTRLQMQRIEQLQTSSRVVDGYYRIESLVATADSMARAANDRVMLYRSGRFSQLSLEGDAVIYSAGEFRDTLLKEVQCLQLEGDTVEIGLPLFTIKFAAHPRPVKQYSAELERIEQKYDDEE